MIDRAVVDPSPKAGAEGRYPNQRVSVIEEAEEKKGEGANGKKREIASPPKRQSNQIHKKVSWSERVQVK